MSRRKKQSDICTSNGGEAERDEKTLDSRKLAMHTWILTETCHRDITDKHFSNPA